MNFQQPLDVVQDIRFAIRVLLKSRSFTLLAATGLALGIGVNTTVFTLVNAALIRGFPFERASEIAFLATRNAANGPNAAEPVSWRELSEWKARSKSFEGIGAYIAGPMNISDPDHAPERIPGASISANTFRLLRVRPLIGRDFVDGEDTPTATPVAILGYRVWKNRFGGDPNVLGRSLKIAEVSYTIVGVMPEGMRFPEIADLYRPLLAPARLELHQMRHIWPFARLAPGVRWTEASAEMRGISQVLRAMYPQTNLNVDARLMTFNESFNTAHGQLVFFALLGAVGFVLLIACANVANLLLARSVYRAREIAVRRALGATRGRIVRQLLIESVLLASFGGIAGLALTVIGVRTFDAVVSSDPDKPYWIVFGLDAGVYVYFAAIVLASGIAFGLAPALQASKTNLNDLVKDGGPGLAGVRSRVLTSALVVVELTLTLALLIGAGLMVRSFLKLYTLDVGVETGHVLTMRTHLIPAKYPTTQHRQLFFDTAEARLRTIPGVTAAAIASAVPLDSGADSRIQVEGRAPASDSFRRRVQVLEVGVSYFETMNVGMRKGRALTEGDGGPGTAGVVVNQQFADEFFAGEDPIGRRCRIMGGETEDQPGPWMTIVGVSPTIRQGGVISIAPAPVIYRAYRTRGAPEMAILLRTIGQPSLYTNAVREAVKSIDPDQPLFALQTLDSVLADAHWPYRVFGSFFVIFGVIALVISSVGIYSITAYAVSRRTREIGVRVALGARPSQISWLVLKTGLLQLAAGLALGSIGAWGVSSVLASLVVQIPPFDPLTFATITILLAGVTLAASFVPAHRATRLDPISALKVE
jgi:putative ABC transport system permease protein